MTLFLVKKLVVAAIMLATFAGINSSEAASQPRFKVLLVSEDSLSNPIHYPMVLAAKAWYGKLATDSNIVCDWVWDTKSFTDAFLANYKVIVQINFSPLAEFWTATSKAAFQKYIEQGTGGWIGMHHASLYGSAVGETGWPWYQTFIGGCQYTGYIAGLATATVRVEDTLHPCMKGVPKSFSVVNDEWYTWSPNPRTNSSVHVLGNVDESTYTPNLSSDPKMGADHPVMWSNQSTAYKARLMYMFMGHSATCYTANPAYTTIVRNAVFWAAQTGTDVKRNDRSQLSRVSPLAICTKIDSKNISLNLSHNVSFEAVLSDCSGRIVSRIAGQKGNGIFTRQGLGRGIYLLKIASAAGCLSRSILLD